MVKVEVNNWCLEDFDTIDDKKYVLLTKYFEQYAPGVTGVHRSCVIYAPKDGWSTKSDALVFAKQGGLKSWHKKGKPSPYGNVGEQMFEVHVIRKSETRSNLAYGDYPDYKLVSIGTKVEH